jgi:hypothetical protein
MKVKFGSIITDGRNKLGGHVYSRNHYGNFSRTNTVPVLVQNDYTQPVRNNFLELVQGYTNLDPADRLTWQSGVVDYPRTNQFGDTYYPTGQTLFTWLNRNLFTIGLGPLSTCPTPVTPTTDLTHTLTISPDRTTITIDFPTPLTDADSTLVIASTRPLPASRNFVSTEFRIIKTLDLSTTGSIDISAEWFDKFTTLSAGGKIFTKLYLINKSCGLSGVEFFANSIASTGYTDLTFELDGTNFVELSIQSSGTADIVITWGDGDIETITPTGGLDVIPHTFPAAGTYITSMTTPEPMFLVLGDAVDIDQFGNILFLPNNCIGLAMSDSTLCTSIADFPSTFIFLGAVRVACTTIPTLPASVIQLAYIECNLSVAPTLPTLCVDVDLTSNILDSAQVNAVLANLVANGESGGNLSIDSQTPSAPPTGAGITDAATLVTNGWTVSTD